MQVTLTGVQLVSPNSGSHVHPKIGLGWQLGELLEQEEGGIDPSSKLQMLPMTEQLLCDVKFPPVAIILYYSINFSTKET